MDRRHVLQILAALGFSGAAAADLAAQATPAVISAPRSRAPRRCWPADFDAARLDVAGRAVQRNLDQMQVACASSTSTTRSSRPTIFRARR